MSSRQILNSEIARKRLRAILDAHREMTIKGQLRAEHDWAATFASIGACALMMCPEFNDDDFIKLLIGKNKMYGDKPIRAWGQIGVIIRIDSKFLRYENLISLGNYNPIVEDTLEDIIGYAVLGYRLVTQR